ncbi:MAG: SDR family NAD(P)-dependent oxidoreductase [Dehalococcoidia bacterium]
MKGERVAVVTGGSRGIGLAILTRLAKDGFRVVGLDINQRALAEAESGLADGDRVRFVEASVLDRPALERVAAEILDAWGRVDALVNNAGVNRPGTIFTQTDEQWDAVLATNLKGAFVASSVFATHLVAGDGGAIVNIGSIAASGRDGSSPAYSASKAGLIGLTRSLASELGRQGVRVNLVAPGVTLTGWVTRNVDPGRIRRMAEAAPLGRAAEPDDIAGAVSFLCSEDARHITGQVLSSSGGFWMP